MKPSLALHIGMPKTGTTALQMRLSASRNMLLKEKILYPSTTLGSAHHFLSLPLDFANVGQRLLSQKIGRDSKIAKREFASAWTKLLSEIERHDPQNVVMSSEYLFSRLRDEDGDFLADKLKQTFQDIRVVAYVRQPSKHLASAYLQRVKFSGTLPRPRPISWKRNLNDWEQRFPGRVMVRVYERALLRDNDIAADFVLHALLRDDVVLADCVSANESMSAEAGLLMQQFQVEQQAGLDNQSTTEKVRLRKRLMKLEKRIPSQGRPKLRAEIAQYIDEGSVELLWLEQAYGVRFPGLDYQKVRNLPRLEGNFKSIRDLFEIDQDRLAQMRKSMQSKSVNSIVKKIWL